MLSIRPWIGIALLAVSWLFGLDYYELPSPWVQAALLVLGAWMLTASERTNPFHAVRESYPELTAAILLFLFPVIWWTPWPYRLAPLVIVAGLLLERTSYAPRLLRPVAAAWVVGGVVLVFQAVALTIYAALTARSHDVPALFVKALAGLCWLVGIDAAGDGPLLVMQSMRQPIRLAVTWDMVFDPVTLLFLVGGLAWITIDAGRRSTVCLHRANWGRNLGRFALIVLAWLPLRAVLMVAIYLHRAALSDTNLPLHVANQFLSSWVLLAALVVPILLAWRWVRSPSDVPEAKKGTVPVSAQQSPEQKGGQSAFSPKPRAPVFGPDTFRSSSIKCLAAAASCLFGAILVAVGLQWEPVGARMAGRVMIVERHAPWSPSDRPYDTESFGGGTDEGSFSYAYSVAYDYLSQYYDMSRLNESDAIDDRTLAGCDVLVIKMPGARYAPEEIQAVLNFVNNGGGLLLIGDHTDLDLTSAHMNDITRSFGFTFRDDVIYSTQPSPNKQYYTAPLAPHPAIQHVPAFDFAVSCSIDPGFSRGRAVVAPAGLWSMPANYHYGNFMPEAQHVPGMRFGTFVQAWATRAGRGRVIAWGDSTIFSNFCIVQPGKFPVLLNLVEWLNHDGGAGVWWLWTLLGLAAVVNGVRLVLEDGSAWLVLLAATACGWTLGTTATAAIMVRALPLPAPVAGRRLPLVVVDRTTSHVPLANADENDDPSGGGFGLLEQWIPRLGYMTVRAEGDDVFQGDAIVMLYPNVPASEAFCRQLVDYVNCGGRLLVIDAGMNDVASTSNQILRPFGLSLDYSQPWGGELVLKEPWPRNHVDHAWEVLGGKSFATLNGERTVCATVEYGQGLVMVVSFGNMFTDRNMGMLWSHDPTAAERTRYDVLFAILRRLVKDEPLVVPPIRTDSPGAKPAKTAPAIEKATVPLKLPPPKNTGFGRHGAS